MLNEQRFLGLDFGTSSCKALLCNTTVEKISSHEESYPINRPRPNWAETESDHYLKALRKVIDKTNLPMHKIAAIGMTGAWGILILADKEGKILRPAILLTAELDKRSTANYSRVIDELKPANIGIEKGPFGPKGPAILLWIKENEPKIYNSISKIFFSIKDFILYRLTGKFVTDYQVACNVLRYNISAKEYPPGLLEMLEIQGENLPMVHNFSDTLYATEKQAKVTGIPSDVPLCVGTGDGPSANVGSGAFGDEVAVSLLSTASTLEVLKDVATVSKKAIENVGYMVSPKLINLGFQICASGETVRWFKDEFFDNRPQSAIAKRDDSYKAMYKEAEQVSAGSESIVFLPYLSGVQMHLKNPNAKGAFFGITFSHTRGHFARSIMEGTGYALREAIEYMETLGIEIREIRLVGASARSSLWCQIIADITNRTTSVPLATEPPALGAALIAAASIGVFSSLKDASKKIKIQNRFEPRKENRKIYDDLFLVFKKGYKCLNQ